MSDEETQEVKQISDIIEPILGEGQVKTLAEFTELLDELRIKYQTSVYKTFTVTATHQKGAGVLLLNGSRDETAEELADRTEREEIERRTIDAAELKEYLRLKKKYGKREE